MAGPPKRRFGQHFLTHPAILARIAEATLASRDEDVLEIGGGKGTLTAALVERGCRVTTIEKDLDLLSGLRTQFPDVRVALGDALELDWGVLAGVPRSELTVVGNIPYNITTPLLELALNPPRPRRVVFLVQKEVADRLAAVPSTKAYGALTVGIQAVASVERLFTVRAGAFDPPPKVDSAMVRITPRAVPAIDDGMTRRFRGLVRALFGARRKQLQRGLRLVTGWPVDRVDRVLDAAGLERAIRPDALPVAGFVALLGAIVDEGTRAG